MANEDEPQVAEFIGSTEVCKRLGIDRGTLTRWIQLGRITPSGKLPGVSGAYLWDPAYIDQVVAARVHSADPVPNDPRSSCGTGVPYDVRDVS